jgi:serine protease Do
VRTPRLIALMAFAAAPLAAQQQPTAAAATTPLETIRKAVVTIHALDANGQTTASGTGFFVTPEGMVITAAHVLSDAAGCSIEMADGETLRCSVAASDTSKDVMMLMVTGTPPAMLRWGSSARVQDGDDISVVSNPLGQLPGTLSKGIVSASRVVNGTRLLQISAPISHGSSGAPLLNAQGQVIGVIRSTIERGQALNFATATDAIRNLQMDPAAVTEAQGMLRKPNLAARVESSGAARANGDPHAIAVGQSMSGDLTSDDELYPDTSYYQRWQLSAARGQDVTVDLVSSDFDPVLIVRGAADTGSLINDDGGPGCASRVVFTAPSGGPFTILVNTTSSPHRQTGHFTLSVSAGAKPVDPRNSGDCQPTRSGAPATTHPLAMGQTVNGQLTASDELYADTTYYQRWQFSAQPGQDVTIDLSSPDFDPVLIVRGTADTSLVNDDGGPGCASRVAFTARSSGPFTALVNTTSTPVRQTGRFELSLTAGRKPVDPPNSGDCRPNSPQQNLREIPERPNE